MMVFILVQITDGKAILDHGFNWTPSNALSSLVGFLVTVTFVFGFGLVALYRQLLKETGKQTAYMQSEKEQLISVIMDNTTAINGMKQETKQQTDVFKDKLTGLSDSIRDLTSNLKAKRAL